MGQGQQHRDQVAEGEAGPGGGGQGGHRENEAGADARPKGITLN